MKKIFSLLIVIALLLCPVLAIGDPNIDGGGQKGKHPTKTDCLSPFRA